MCDNCEKLHECLQEMNVLKRTIINLRKELKGERRKVEHFRKENDKQHLRKGQKRGKFGRNG
jgi:hypothetical protein